MANTLVVAGMHRSGTSLTANWLAHSGLFVGDTLLANRVDNPAGHYEDVDFLHFQEDILRANHLNYQVLPGEQLTVSDEHRARARALIDARADQPMWGWKDPRTTLLLPFWKNLIPDMKVLIVYRHYALVAESMLRRERKSPRNQQAVPASLRWALRLRFSFWNTRLLRRYLRVWIRYNHAALDFAAAYPDDCLVVDIEQFGALSQAIIRYANVAWGFNLAALDGNEVKQADLLREDIGLLARSTARLIEPSCDVVLAQLRTQFEQTQTRLAACE